MLDSSKLKDFAGANSKFYENSGKFSKEVENIMGKGEFARYEQILLFFTMFLKDLYWRQGLVCGRIKFCCLVKRYV